MIPSEGLGIGAVCLSAIAMAANGDRIYTQPLWLNIKPAPISPAVSEDFSGEPGLLATLQYKNAVNKFKTIDNLDGQYKNLMLEKIQINGQRYLIEAPMVEYGLVYLPMFLIRG